METKTKMHESTERLVLAPQVRRTIFSHVYSALHWLWAKQSLLNSSLICRKGKISRKSLLLTEMDQSSVADWAAQNGNITPTDVTPDLVHTLFAVFCRPTRWPVMLPPKLSVKVRNLTAGFWQVEAPAGCKKNKVNVILWVCFLIPVSNLRNGWDEDSSRSAKLASRRRWFMAFLKQRQQQMHMSQVQQIAHGYINELQSVMKYVRVKRSRQNKSWRRRRPARMCKSFPSYVDIRLNLIILQCKS